MTTDTVMTNLVTFEPNAVAPEHHHVEEQIAIVLSGEMTFTSRPRAAIVSLMQSSAEGRIKTEGPPMARPSERPVARRRARRGRGRVLSPGIAPPGEQAAGEAVPVATARSARLPSHPAARPCA